MKSYIKIFFDNEVLAYLFFGVATTLVAVSTRLLVFHWTDQEQLATIIGKKGLVQKTDRFWNCPSWNSST